MLVGNRGMLTAARLREDVGPVHLDWITALRAPQVKNLVRDSALQLTLFDQTAPCPASTLPGPKAIDAGQDSIRRSVHADSALRC